MKKVAIIQPNYIPWKGYFDMINYVDEFIILDDVQYTKNDWRNRNKIQTDQGEQWLTIPIKQTKLNQLINESKVSYRNWNEKHWKTLVQNYGKAEGFQLFEEYFFKLYTQQKSLFLLDIDLKFTQAINQLLNINTKITLSSDLKTTGSKTDKLVDLCSIIGASTYVSSPKAKAYLNETLFTNVGMNVEWYEYKTDYSYPSIHQNQTPYISILDLIFNVGKNSPNFILK